MTAHTIFIQAHQPFMISGDIKMSAKGILEEMFDTSDKISSG